MAKTRSAQSSSNTAGTKRAATKPSSSPAAKRGKTSKMEQTTIEDSKSGIEEDKDVEKQINAKENEDDGQMEKKNNDLQEGETNGFDEVKSDENDGKLIRILSIQANESRVIGFNVPLGWLIFKC
jgi:hypothetical protein